MSLIAWYPLTKDFKDYSTKKRHFTNYNWDDSKTSEGKFGCALDCTDTLYRINGIPLPTDVKLSEFSISCWFYLTSKSNGNLVNMGENGGFRLRLVPEGNLLAHFATTNVSTGTATVFISDAIFEINEWYNVTVVYKDKKLYTYINNSLNKTSDISSYEDAIVINTARNTLTLGGSIYGSNYEVLKGYLNNVKIYDHALSLEEVKQDYLQPMLHYTFENSYAEETTNIPHSLVNTDYVTLGEDSIGKYITKTSTEWWAGIKINNANVLSGRTYTWSMEVMPIKDINYFIDTNAACLNSEHAGSNDSHFSAITRNSDYRRLEAHKWNKIFVTVKIKSECSNPTIFCTFCPTMPNGDTEVKVYYRNSQLEEKPYDTPYTSFNREAGLIRDNSGMGNDGTQVYQRIEIPIESTTPTSAQGLTDTVSNGTHTIKGFNGTTNQCINFGRIKYNSLYHYVGATVCYEFDLKVTDMTAASGQTPKLCLQGLTYLNNNTGAWYGNPICNDDLYKRINSGKNGTYHICLQKKITVAAGVTNVISYGFGVRFDYIKSGTITISNLHAYYGSLDTSTLSLSDNSAIGTHSAYFNGRNRINCGVATPDEMDELTLSCWIYQNDWTNTNFLKGRQGSIAGTNFSIANVGSGGFGFKVENGTNTLNLCTKHTDQNWSTDCLFDYTTLSPGWHLFTGIATKNKKQIYVDGELKKEVTHNNGNPIINHADSYKAPFSIGGEICNTDPNNNLVDVYVDDVRLYSTALSPEDIKALYNVKTRIDNKSNLYCNQLVETKPENMMKPLSEVDLDNDLAKFYSSGTFSYKDGIIKYTISSGNSSYASGFYISNKNYGGPLITGEKYRYDFYVKVSKAGEYLLGEEKLAVTTKTLESGKWYHIIKEGTVKGVNQNFIIYNNAMNLANGDTIEVRDVKLYRLYDTDKYTQEITKKGQYKTFELDETSTDSSNFKMYNRKTKTNEIIEI